MVDGGWRMEDGGWWMEAGLSNRRGCRPWRSSTLVLPPSERDIDCRGTFHFRTCPRLPEHEPGDTPSDHHQPNDPTQSTCNTSVRLISARLGSDDWRRRRRIVATDAFLPRVSTVCGRGQQETGSLGRGRGACPGLPPGAAGPKGTPRQQLHQCPHHSRLTRAACGAGSTMGTHGRCPRSVLVEGTTVNTVQRERPRCMAGVWSCAALWLDRARVEGLAGEVGRRRVQNPEPTDLTCRHVLVAALSRRAGRPGCAGRPGHV